MREPLSEIAQRVNPSTFVRIHRSTIVNIDHIRELQPAGYGEFTVVLTSGRRVRCSRTYAAGLTALLQF